MTSAQLTLTLSPNAGNSNAKQWQLSHLYMQAHHPFRQLLAHFETFWDISSNFGKFWANLSNFEQFWAVFSGQLGQFRAILNIFVGQVWVMSSNSEQFMEARYGSVDLGQYTCSIIFAYVHIIQYYTYIHTYIYIYIYWLMIRRRKYTRPICPFQGLAASLDLALSAGSPWKVTQELQLGQHLESRNCSLERQRWWLVVT